MEKFIRWGTDHVYGVTAVHGESGTVWHVVDCAAPESEQPAIVASYREKWRAEMHAIRGCGCQQNWHLYHGNKCEEVVLLAMTVGGAA